MRHSPGLAHIPVLLLASAFEIVDTARAHAVGANGILSKPFDPAVVIGRVHELLNLGTPVARAAAPGPSPTVAPPALLLPPADPPPLQLTDEGPPHEPVEPEPASPVSTQPDDSDGYAAMDVDDELPLASPAPAIAASDVDSYFESIDQAFTQLNLSRRPLPGLDVDEPFELPDLPLTSPLEHAPPSVVEAPAFPSPAPAPAPASVSLADAFSALLEAESGAVSPPAPAPVVAAPAPVVASPAPIATPAVDMDALVEQVTKRVLEQLSDRVVRETVSDIVLTTAERLVREELERITRNIP